MSEEAIYKLHRYPSGELEEFEYVQDLVRCKECNAYMTDGYADGCGFCAYHHSVVKADDFCSYGERESEQWRK